MGSHFVSFRSAWDFSAEVAEIAERKSLAADCEMDAVAWESADAWHLSSCVSLHSSAAGVGAHNP